MNVLAKVKGKLNRDGLMATVIAILRFHDTQSGCKTNNNPLH